MKSIVVGLTKSAKPRKQRAYFFGMPLHKAQKSMAVLLSKPLRKELGKRAIGARKGDGVRVMRGNRSGSEGKVTRVYYKKRQVFIENIVRKKSSGAEVGIAFDNSNLMLIELDRKDERRLKRIQTKPEKTGKKRLKKKKSKKEVRE